MCVYNTGAVAFRGAQFGPANGPVFLDQLVCSGSETSVLECRRFTPLGLPTCDHSQDAGVRCAGKALKALPEMYTHKKYCLIPLCFLLDVDECSTTNGDCEQNCTNAIGSFECSCGIGYLLNGNGFNCTGKFTITRYY